MWLALGNASAQAQEATDPPTDEDSAFEAGAIPVPAPAPEDGLPEVETIISDTEFNETVPGLDPVDDPELERPLESIAEFERRIAEESATADGGGEETTELVPDALADGDPVEEIGDAPIRDAQLTKPLPPLEEFELNPVEFEQPADDPETVEVRYAVEVNGLDDARRESDIDLVSRFRALSALGKGSKAANTAMIAARLEEDSQLMETILASEGWYTPVIATRLDRREGEGGEWIVAVLDVVPGRRYRLSRIEIVAQPTQPPGLIRDSLALEPGEPIVAERIQGAEAQVSVTLPQEGYPFAEVGQREVLLDRETGEGEYTLPVDTGPRSRFGGFATEGDLAFDAEHIAVLARFERGELYDSRKIDDLRKALVGTSLFSTVTVEPKKTGEAVGDGTEYVTVFVEQDAGPPRTIAGSAGYGTGEGFRFEGSWTHHNMFPPEGALIFHGIAGTKEQGGGATFRRSNAGKRDRTFELAAEALHSDFDAYSAYTGRLGAQWRHASTPIWQKKFTYAFGLEALATAERDFDFDLGERDRRTYYIAGVNGLAAFDFTDDLLDPTRGFKASLIVRPEGSLDGGFNFYVKSQVDASGYFPASDNIVLAGRVRMGSIQGAGRDKIAPSRRFFAGGGGSVRGYGYQKLGLLDPNGDPIGGRSVNEASAEVRYRFGNFGIVGFVDVGQSYIDTLPQFSDLRYGAGIGGRYYTNFGPLRVDLATPINRRPGDSRINVYVSIGQAF